MIPFFSIILPTFNQAEFLKICLKSILKQTYNNWELIIINNSSIDNTSQVIKSFKDKRIRVLNINNKGLLAKSRNKGIKNAKANWICFIDTDDIWYPDKLMYMKKFIDTNDGDLFYHDLVFENKSFFLKKKIIDKSKTIKRPILKYFAEYGNPIGQSSVVVKKKILKKINYISENKEKFSWEDFDTWIKISKITDKFIRVPFILGSIWIGPENISSLDRQISNTKNIKKYYYKTFNKFLSKKDKNKNLWWLEYPSILKDFRDKNIDSFLNRVKKLSISPLKFNFIICYMKKKLFFIKIIRELRKIFSIVIMFKNEIISLNIDLKNNKYKKINSKKDLNKINFDNFKLPKIFFERIDYKNELHLLYKKNILISYGWSSKNKRFLISELNCEIKNNKNVIFFDFFTIENFRKKGFYELLLKKMLINFKKNRCFIYSTLFNFQSLRVIKKSNFKFENFFTFFRNKINLVK